MRVLLGVVVGAVACLLTPDPVLSSTVFGMGVGVGTFLSRGQGYAWTGRCADCPANKRVARMVVFPVSTDQL